jgi:regulator of replication initiation timing
MPSSEKDKAVIQEQLDLLYVQIAQIRGRMEKLLQENQRLTDENNRLNLLINIQKKSLKSLERNHQVSRYAHLLSAKDKGATKQVLSKMIKELDDCITLLHGLERSPISPRPPF